MIKVFILVMSALINTAQGPAGHTQLQVEDSLAVCQIDAEKFLKQGTDSIEVDAQCITVQFKAPAKPGA